MRPARDGHAHGLANPHYWLDPANAEVMTGGIAEAVIRVAPELTEKIIANRDEFLTRLKEHRGPSGNACLRRTVPRA